MGLRPVLVFFLSALPLLGAEPRYEVEGQRYLNARRMLAALPAFEEEAMRDSMAREDYADEAESSLLSLYRELGFFEARTRVRVHDTVSRVGKPLTEVRIEVEEGNRYRFSKVSVRLPDSAAIAWRPPALAARPGQPFSDLSLLRDRAALEKSLGQAGYMHATVAYRTRIVAGEAAVEVEFQVEPGRLILIDSLALRNSREGEDSGGGLTREASLRDLAGFRRGDTLRLGESAELSRKLRSTGVFNYVRIRDSLLSPDSLAEGKSGSMLILATEERVPGEFEYGAFYESQYKFGVSARLRHNNLFGRFYQSDLRFVPAQLRQSVRLGFASPLLFGTAFRFDNTFDLAWYQDKSLYEEYPPFTGDIRGTYESKLTRSFFSFARFSSSAEYDGLRERNRVVEDSAIRIVRNAELNLNFINAWHMRFLDDGIAPTRGVRGTLTWGNGGPFLKEDVFEWSAFRHNWIEVETAYYLPVIRGLRLAFRADGGRFFGNGGLNSRRFFLGGPRSVRSFRSQSLCPRDPSTGLCRDEVEPAYGLASAEAHLGFLGADFIGRDGWRKYLNSLEIVPFTDYGRVWEWGETPLPEGEGVAFGLGLRYRLLSVFSLRIDQAFGNRGQRQLVFDLAQAF